MFVNSRLVMGLSAAFLAVLGLAVSFAPHEVLAGVGAQDEPAAAMLLQVAGASLVGWALVNWTARGLVIGGIYARPLTFGNFLHFFVGAFSLGKLVVATSTQPVLVAVFVGYLAFAIVFGLLLFGVLQSASKAERSRIT